MRGKKPMLFLLGLLVVFNLIIVVKYFSSSTQPTSSFHYVFHNDVELNVMKASNEIALKLPIMDIYRLDISCDYVVKDLGQNIDTRFKNSEKKCSLASAFKNVNALVEQSLNEKPSNSEYQPYLVESKFDPFDTNEPSETFKQFKSLRPGGVWQPQSSLFRAKSQCRTNDLENIVFIVPFSRARLQNLKYFLINMHAYLQTTRYPFNYRILVTEQIASRDGEAQMMFNKGQILNTAMNYALENLKERVDCIVIHDVDLVPLREGPDYRCNLMPVHLTRRVFFQNTNKVRTYNQFLTGGILSLRPGHIMVANGYSNLYFGWGGEDDDWTLRMFNKNLCIMRPLGRDEENRLSIDDQNNPKNAFFIMLDHVASKANKKRFDALTSALQRQNYDGLNRVKQLAQITRATEFKTFTHIQVQLNKQN